MKPAALALLLAVATSPAIAAPVAGAPGVTIRPVARTHSTITGQAIEVPPDPDVLVSIATFQPGARLPVHKHLYPHLVYVLQGTLTVINVETGKTFDVRQGDFVAEMQNTWHYGTNNSKAPVRLLVVDEVPQGIASNVVAKQK
jgi:quercetin dioxygenase-like cupin family protein